MVSDANIGSTVVVSMIIVCVIADVVIKRFKLVWLPESVAAMGIGATVAIVARIIGTEALDALSSFHPDLFFFILLPPIIFDAGYTLKKRSFFNNFGSILAYAFVGTLISTLAIGFALYEINKLQLISAMVDPSIYEFLMFASLISATDPVATLNIFSSPSVDAPPLLYSLVFGESVLNDAVAIVLFETFSGFRDKSISRLSDAFGIFFAVSLGSTAIGFAFALVLSFLTHHVDFAKFTSPHYETTLMLLTAFLSYYVPQIFGLSGIMSLFFCGIGLSHYNLHNISHESQEASHIMFKTLAQLCETFVFIYLGIVSILSIVSESDEYVQIYRLILWTLLLTFVSRAIQVFPISWLLNLLRKRTIPMRMQACIWFAGLRGAIAFTLSMSLTTPNAIRFQTCTLTVVVFTTVVCGALTEPFMRWMRMRGQDLLDDQDLATLAMSAEDKQRAEKEAKQDQTDVVVVEDRDSGRRVSYGSLNDLAGSLEAERMHRGLDDDDGHYYQQVDSSSSSSASSSASSSSALSSSALSSSALSSSASGLRIRPHDHPRSGTEERDDDGHLDGSEAGGNPLSHRLHGGFSRFTRYLKRFDDNVMKRFFGGRVKLRAHRDQYSDETAALQARVQSRFGVHSVEQTVTGLPVPEPLPHPSSSSALGPDSMLLESRRGSFAAPLRFPPPSTASSSLSSSSSSSSSSTATATPFVASDASPTGSSISYGNYLNLPTDESSASSSSTSNTPSIRGELTFAVPSSPRTSRPNSVKISH